LGFIDPIVASAMPDVSPYCAQEPDDVATEYLLGEGGSNITGSVLTIDAGNTA
jgi:hypothetical protein